MYCKHCNTYLSDGTTYCPNCGTAVSSITVENSSYPAVPQGNTTTPLVWGIMGLAFSCSFYFSLLGIIFSIIGKNKAKHYISTYGDVSKKVKVGKNLATAGLIVGIIFCVLSTLVIVAVVAESM